MNFYLMLAGRTVFGIGSECLLASVSSVVAFWFQNKNLSFAIAMTLSCAKIAGSANNAVTPYIDEKT